MIYTYLEGRLGNCLFEIAAGASLAKRMNVPFKALTCYSIDMPEYIKPFRQSILRNIDFSDIYPKNQRIYQEPDCAYQPLPEEKNLLLKGYFQSEKYFDEELVKYLFEIDIENETYIQKKYGHILQLNPVAIHVRRGDYLLLEYMHPVCRMSYFSKAMTYFEEGTPFLIISDDIVWCKKHFKGDHFYFVDAETPLTDLYLQSMCTHNIISNSTFSWWGAWLNPNPDKKVIYPDPWFGLLVRKKEEFDTKDLCPDSWISVPLGKFDYYFYGIRARCRYLLKRFVKKIIREIKQKCLKICQLFHY